MLRRFDPIVAATTEQRYGLPDGSLHATAFAPERLVPAITGQVTHAEWMAGVASALAASGAGNGDAPAAVAAWQAYPGELDAAVLQLVRALRAEGVPVAIGSNATDRLPADLERLGLVGEVDAVINSSVLGHPKPLREFFLAACTAPGTPPAETLLVDDTDRHVRAAREVGLAAYRYTGPQDLRYVRAALRPTVAADQPLP